MVRALMPSSGLGPFLAKEGLPELALRWQGMRLMERDAARYAALTGLPWQPGRPEQDPAMDLMLPQVCGFPLQLALLTHPRFPLPIWRALQIRNRIVLHRPPGGAAGELHARLSALRLVEKGVELDVHSRLLQGEQLVWQAVNTFYYRGRFGQAQAESSLRGSPPLVAAAEQRLLLGRGGAWSMGVLTGDFNGLHLFRPYARLFGYRDAFAHPPLTLGLSLARLAPAGSLPFSLETWIRGPIHYRRELLLRHQESGHQLLFQLSMAGENRPGLVGRLLRGQALLNLDGNEADTERDTTDR
jgi:hypothetical protein